MKGYKAKSQKGKARGVKSGGSQASRTCLPGESHTRASLSLQCVLTAGRPGCQPGKLLGTLARALPGAGLLGCLGLACTDYRLSKGKQVFRANHVVRTCSLGTVSHSYQLWNDENSP